MGTGYNILWAMQILQFEKVVWTKNYKSVGKVLISSVSGCMTMNELISAFKHFQICCLILLFKLLHIVILPCNQGQNVLLDLEHMSSANQGIFANTCKGE